MCLDLEPSFLGVTLPVVSISPTMNVKMTITFALAGLAHWWALQAGAGGAGRGVWWAGGAPPGRKEALMTSKKAAETKWSVSSTRWQLQA